MSSLRGISPDRTNGNQEALLVPWLPVLSLFLGLVERVTGIEPAQSVWKTETLPLSYTRICGFDSALIHSMG